jgi:hypothetical protein
MFIRKPTDFPCPLCGAGKGEKCRTLSKRERKPHDERKELSRSLNRWEAENRRPDRNRSTA